MSRECGIATNVSNACLGEKGWPRVGDGLIAFCRARLSHIKCPRSIDFAAERPRTSTGKLVNRVLRDRYRARAA